MRDGFYKNLVYAQPRDFLRCVFDIPPHPFRLIRCTTRNARLSFVSTKRTIQYYYTMNKLQTKGLESIQDPNRFKQLCKTNRDWTLSFSKILHGISNPDIKNQYYQAFGITANELKNTFGLSYKDCQKNTALHDRGYRRELARELKKDLRHGNFENFDSYGFTQNETDRIGVNREKYVRKQNRKLNQRGNSNNLKAKIKNSCLPSLSMTNTVMDKTKSR